MKSDFSSLNGGSNHEPIEYLLLQRMVITQTAFNQGVASGIAGGTKGKPGAVGKEQSPDAPTSFKQKSSLHLVFTLGICITFI